MPYEFPPILPANSSIAFMISPVNFAKSSRVAFRPASSGKRRAECDFNLSKCSARSLPTMQAGTTGAFRQRRQQCDACLRLDLPAAVARALGKDSDGAAGFQHRERAPDRRGRAALPVDRIGPERAYCRPEDGNIKELFLRHIADAPRTETTHQRRIEVRDVIAGDDQRSARRNVFRSKDSRMPEHARHRRTVNLEKS